MSTTSSDRQAIDDEIAQLRSIGDLADDETIEDTDGQTRMLDFGDTIDLKVKGNKPTGSEIKIRSISLPIKGQIEQGQTGTMVVTWRCQDVAFKGKYDGDGRELSNTRHHLVTPVAIVPISEDQAGVALGIEPGK